MKWIPSGDYKKVTFDTVADVICGSNYLKLIERKKIESKYEIYSALMGITVDRIGIDFYEFSPGKTFTNDFGIG